MVDAPACGTGLFGAGLRICLTSHRLWVLAGLRVGNPIFGINYQANSSWCCALSLLKETMTKQVQLDKIRADILADKVTPQLAVGATQLVFGDGNPDAEIVFVGEAPGKNEDLQGLPFVGAAGKFLNEMLASIGFARNDIYITNIVKYRPSNNRDPLPEEKEAFLPYLIKQLDVIRPKIVATLGRHSMECFMPAMKISDIHGQPKRLQKQVYLPLFHPAAALYNGGMRQTLMDDFAQIPKILKQISKAPNNDVNLNSNSDEMKEVVDRTQTQKTIFDSLA